MAETAPPTLASSQLTGTDHHILAGEITKVLSDAFALAPLFPGQRRVELGQQIIKRLWGLLATYPPAQQTELAMAAMSLLVLRIVDLEAAPGVRR